ncbi:hypothetical protein GCM10010256_11410 [Streptomyces coeruleorubidus]|nr:hypothetical protein GCM10010256_11410 [Streptomyces coeruleorubidus]
MYGVELHDSKHGEGTGVTDDNARGRTRVRRARRWLVAASTVVAVAGGVATEVLNAGTHEQSVDPGGAAEWTEPVQSPSPSCHPSPEAGREAVTEARPGDREFEVVAVSSLCSDSESDNE